jgi:putative transposase
LNSHIDYIHHHPVKHGWVERVMDWPHSSFHRYVRQGLSPATWGYDACSEPVAGEPGGAV